MKIEELNPFIRHAKMHAHYHIGKENSICYDCRLFYSIKGNGHFCVNGETHPFPPNTVIFLPPKTEYRFFFPEDDEFGFYIFNFDLTDEFHYISQPLGTATRSTFEEGKSPAYAPPPEFSNIIIQRNASSVFNHLEHCVRLFLRKDTYYKLSASASLKLALVQLLREQNGEKSDYRLMESVLEYIKENYGNCELDNKAVAAHFGYHPYYLNELMKRHTKRTLHCHIIEYRLHMARHYLATTNLSVTAVAEKAGFASYTYFIKCFRERVKITPLQYRKAGIL